MLKLKLLNNEPRKSLARPDLRVYQQWRLFTFLTSLFLILDFSRPTPEQSNLPLVCRTLCVSELKSSRRQSWGYPEFLMCSAVKMCSAIFTSCFELSCVSCPLTKQKLADLMCITQLKKKMRQGFRYARSKSTWIIGLFWHLGIWSYTFVLRVPLIANCVNFIVLMFYW